MTDRTKRSIVTVTLLILGVFFTMMALTIVGVIGRASAQGVGGVVVIEPQDTVLQIYNFIKDGEHLPAVGAGLMLLVWFLRWAHEKLPAPVGPFFKTKLGGYVLGFGTAMNIYVGTALIAGQAVTLGLFLQALGTGFAASGKWEGLMDVLKKAPKVSSTSVVTLVLLVALASGCRPVKDETIKVGQDVVDCTVGELVHLGGVVPLILPTLGQSPDWSIVADELTQAGGRVGLCTLAMLIDRWRSNLKLATPEGSAAADKALAQFKARFKVSVVKTTEGAR